MQQLANITKIGLKVTSFSSYVSDILMAGSRGIESVVTPAGCHSKVASQRGLKGSLRSSSPLGAHLR